MTDAPETAAEEIAAPAPAPVRARALAGLVDLVPSDALILLLGKLAGQAGFIAGLVVVVGSFSVCEARWGRTPGKALLGLEVRFVDGTPCDARGAVIRNVFRFLDWFPGIYLVGGFAIAGTRRRQRLGDQAAGTSVYARGAFATTASDA